VSENQPQAAAERVLRFIYAAALPQFILAITLSTPDPASDIKRLLLAWTATVLGLGWLGVAWWFKISFRRPPLFFWLLTGMLVLHGIASVPSEFPGQSLVAVCRLVLLCTLYLVASQVYHTEKQIRLFFLLTCLGMVAASGYAFIQQASLDPIPWSDKDSDVYRNLPSTFGHPNFAAHALMFAIPFAGYLAATGMRAAWLMVAVFLLYLNATDQRAGWLALAGAAGLVAMGALLGQRFRRPIVGALASIGATALAGLAAAGSYVLFMIARSGVAFPIDESLLLRYQSYVSAARMFFDRPLLGHGPGVYALKNPIYWTPFEQQWFAQERRMMWRVHNDLMEYGINAGMFGAGLYLALLATGVVYSLTYAFRARDQRHRMLGYCFAFTFTAFGIDGLFGFNSFVPVSAALWFITMGMLDARYESRALRVPMPRATAAALSAILAVTLVASGVMHSLVFSAQQDMQRGIALHEAQRYDEARRSFERGHAKTPWDWDFYRHIGHTMAAREDFDGAIAQYHALLDRNPYYLLTRLPLSHAMMRRAQLFLQQNPDKGAEALEQLDLARQELDTALVLCPMLPEAHQMHGQISSVGAIIAATLQGGEAVQRTQQYWRDAEHHYEEAARYKLEDMGGIYTQLAKVRVALNDLPGAEHALTEAVRRDPHDITPWPAFLDFVLKFARFDQARNVLIAQIRQLESEASPDYAAITTLQLFLANILENGYSDIDGALGAYRKAMALEPGRPEIWTNFARFARQRQRMDDFRAALLEAVANQGEKAREVLPGQVMAASLYLRDGMPALEGASSVLLATVRSYRPEAQKMSVTDATGWAVDMLQAALQTAPVEEQCITAFNLGLCRNALGQYELAVALLQVLDKCMPADQASAYALHLADALTGLKQLEQAQAVLERAMTVNPDDLEVRWALARNLARSGKRERAIEVYDGLLAESGIDFKGKAMLEQERAGLK
jgi:tetratricopeptide (TPR) repeat protein/O-antigen ligase